MSGRVGSDQLCCGRLVRLSGRVQDQTPSPIHFAVQVAVDNRGILSERQVRQDRRINAGQQHREIDKSVRESRKERRMRGRSVCQ